MKRLLSWRIGTSILAASLAVAAFSISDTRASLVSNWRLDDTAAPAVCDVTSTYNGAFSGVVTPNQPGKIGTAYAFGGDSPGGAVVVDPNGSAAPPAPAPSPLGTVSAWVKPDAGLWSGNIVYNQTPTFIQFRLEDIGSGKRLVYRQDGGHDTVVNSSYGSVTDGVWTHVVATVQPSVIQLFINGALGASSGGSNNYISTDSTLLQIGAGAGVNFYGLIDDVAIWDTALSAGKIGTLSTILNVNGGALGGYNAFLMDKLFQSYDTNTKQVVTSDSTTMTWEKFTGGSGTAGTVTFEDGKYYAWFDSTSGVMGVPEPGALTLAGLGGLGILVLGRRQLRRRSTKN